jgi:hypothetical protein
LYRSFAFIQYYGLYKKTNQLAKGLEISPSMSTIRASSLETSYNESKEKMKAILPSFDENDEHFKGVMFYKVWHFKSKSSVSYESSPSYPMMCR